jgi:hypothetical protein
MKEGVAGSSMIVILGILVLRFAKPTNSGGGKLNIMNLKTIFERWNSYFCFVEASGLLAMLTVEV